MIFTFKLPSISHTHNRIRMALSRVHTSTKAQQRSLIQLSLIL